LAKTQKVSFCPAAEIAPRAVKEVFSLVVAGSLTGCAPFSASTFWGVSKGPIGLVHIEDVIKWSTV
jgi:hypothetical protein